MALQCNWRKSMAERISCPGNEIEIPGRTPGGHYSAAVVAGDFIFVAGQVPRDDSRKLIGETIEEQTHATLDNVERVLEAAGASLSSVVKVSVYLADLALFPRFNAVYASRFTKVRPVRTTIGCGLQGVLIEIDAVAYKEPGDTGDDDLKLPVSPFKIKSAQ
jgi:2-iminobutanoate/2-iminopropanoate deaminase